MDEFVVHKFGGSCLREGSDIDRIAEVIQNVPGRPLVVVSALWGMTDRLFRAAREPQYAGRLVNDLKSQHLLFAPGLDTGEFSELFKKVISGISNELVNLSSGEYSLRSENLILAAGERLSALAVAHRLRSIGLDANPIGAEDIGLKLKGKGRPINPLEERMALIQALKFVDYVVPFSEDTPLKLIEFLKPNVLVKGADYKVCLLYTSPSPRD